MDARNEDQRWIDGMMERAVDVVTTSEVDDDRACQRREPAYLYNLLQLHQPSRALRSSTQQLLQVPYMSTDFGRRAFSYSSSATWNSIPTSIKIARPYIVSSAT